jgi:autotransporter-associated beta strand protein
MNHISPLSPKRRNKLCVYSCFALAFTCPIFGGSSLKAATYTYARTTANDAGTVDLWSTGANWDAAPISETDTVLNIGGNTVLGSGDTIFTSNDTASPFLLKDLKVTYKGPDSGVIPVVTISGAPLQITDGGQIHFVYPFTNVNPAVTISNDIIASGTVFLITEGQDTLSGRLSGGEFQKYGDLTLNVSGGILATPSSFGKFYAGGGITNFTGVFEAGQLIIGGGAGTFNSSGMATLSIQIGVADNAGGTLNVTAGNMNSSTFWVGNNAAGVANISGGTVAVAGPVFIGGGYDGNGGGTGTLNISNTGIFSTGTSSGSFQVGAGTAAGAGSGTINLDGGTFATGRSISLGGGANATAKFYFNGGTLQATADNSDWIRVGANSGFVKAGGAVIDTQSFSVRINQGLLADPNSAGGGLTKNGSGTLALGGVNTFTGKTTVNGSGTLLLDSPGVAISSTGASGAGATAGEQADNSDVQINSGATLRLARPDQIISTAKIGLSGGTIATDGFDQGTTEAVGIGALTLSADSVIDFGILDQTVVHFAGSNGQTWDGTLDVWNWSGNAFAGGGPDQLIFGNDGSGLTAEQLSSIRFFSDSGGMRIGFGPAAILMNGEIVPVPEPTAKVAGIAMLAMAGYREGNRRCRLARRRVIAAIPK